MTMETAAVPPTPRRAPAPYFVAGLVLLAAPLVQLATGFRWAPLAAWQDNDIYRQLSGFLLLAFVAHQWYFPWLRLRGDGLLAARRAGLHKLLGATAPLLYFLHAREPGFAYLLALSIVFLAVFLTGLVNPETTGARQPWFRSAWTLLHVGSSTLLPVITGYHVWMTYLYE